MLVSKSYQHSDQASPSLLAKMATVKSAEPGNNSFGINHIIRYRSKLSQLGFSNVFLVQNL